MPVSLASPTSLHMHANHTCMFIINEHDTEVAQLQNEPPSQLPMATSCHTKPSLHFLRLLCPDEAEAARPLPSAEDPEEAEISWGHTQTWKTASLAFHARQLTPLCTRIFLPFKYVFF